MQALVAGCCENAELTKKGHCRGSYATPVIDKRLSPENTCRGCVVSFLVSKSALYLRRMPHMRDREEMAARADSAIKYRFILRIDLVGRRVSRAGSSPFS